MRRSIIFICSVISARADHLGGKIGVYHEAGVKAVAKKLLLRPFSRFYSRRVYHPRLAPGAHLLDEARAHNHAVDRQLVRHLCPQLAQYGRK